MASNNLDDFRDLSNKADKQLQELERMLNKHQGDSDDTAQTAKQVERQNDMLKETTQRPSALRKQDEQNNLRETQTLTHSGNE